MNAEMVRDLFTYDPSDGILRWRKVISSHLTGDVAGTRKKRAHAGYIEVRHEGKFYMAHRLIFLWMTGRWPDPQIDHVNRDGYDNRWCNLREATAAQNAANRKVSTLNKLKLKGAIKVTRFGVTKYEARIRVNGKQLHLGRYDTAQEAHLAYVKASEAHFGEFSRPQ
jgi:hypothetical protein